MSPPQKIIFDAAIGEGGSQWYGTITLRNIRYADDAPVTVREFLGVRFKGPRVSADVAVQTALEPFQATKLEAETQDLEGPGGEVEGVIVTAKVRTEGPHTFGASDALTWTINGDVVSKGEEYLKSFEIWADEVPEEKEGEVAEESKE